MDGPPLSDWIGRQDCTQDVFHGGPAQALAATLNRDPSLFAQHGALLPPLWNWLYFLPRALSREVGDDGHPKRGGFLPPIDLPRRMWAGSRCDFRGPLKVGDKATKTSTITNIVEKNGRAGPMIFITVTHDISVEGANVYYEEQDIVYMNIPAVFSPPPATLLPPCAWTHDIKVDPVLLFRFSALTFNGHRIHYDRDYATKVENYPGLVVHGPLQAIMAFDTACHRMPGREASRFTFRGMAPLFDFDDVSIGGCAIDDTGTKVFTANGDAAIAMEATVTWT